MPRDFKTILCPTDFSEHSGRAIEYGVRFARNSEGLLLLAHIIHIPTEHFRDDLGHVIKFDDLKVGVQLKLQEFRDKYVDGYDKCELISEIGDPYEQLMAIVEQRKVDLLVTSTHGRTAINHLVMGSVAEKIVRHATCPVFIVRRGVA